MGKRDKFAYVILHYNTTDDTVACVNSIDKHMDGEQHDIIIVDNKSPNGSGQTVKEMFEGRKDVHVILNDSNMGFARGNNVGFRYAKYELQADYIVLLNSDTLILHDNFQPTVTEAYDKHGYAVIGPRVLIPTAPYQSNPLASGLPSLRQVIWHMCLLSVNLAIAYTPFTSWAHRNLGTSDEKRAEVKKCELEKHTVTEEGVVLCGAFLIFTPAYISMFDGLDDRTFLYGEEQLLFLRCRQNGLTMAFLPTIEIMHNEGSSTSSMNFKDIARRKRFTHKHIIYSRYILAREMVRERLFRKVTDR